MQGVAGLLAVGLAVGGREAARVGEAPPAGDVGDGGAGAGVGFLQVAVGGGEPGPPQVGQGRDVLVLTELLLQGTRADPGGAGDLGKPDVRIVMVIDERESAPQRRRASVVLMLGAGTPGRDGKGFQEMRRHQPGGLIADERAVARDVAGAQAPQVEVELIQGARVLGRTHR